VVPAKQTSGPVILLGGPTASGKSGLALRMAEAIGGELINADSMQVYGDLQVLTARPKAEDLLRCTHHLFGHMDAARRCSVGLWQEEARAMAQSVEKRGSVPILVGGTGFYLNAFRYGMSPIPDVPETIRENYTRRMDTDGSVALHDELATRDPKLAAGLAPGDSQRIQRALEVMEATGRPLSDWQEMPREGGWNGPLLFITLMPPRQALYDLCDARFDAMIANGAREEVRRLSARNLDSSLPAMRALGVAELLAAETGELEREEAVTRAKTGTRRYAKRQSTWFRNQVSDAIRIEAFGFDEAAETAISATIRFLLTQKASPA
jgi:tRNA dimethylallyltransferase